MYRMLVHLFGAVSSPSCSNASLQRTAVDHKESFSAEICQAVNKSFYMDDFTISSQVLTRLYQLFKILLNYGPDVCLDSLSGLAIIEMFYVQYR